MSTEPSWDLYGAFLATVEEGSLSGAARRLGVAQPTVRRQIEALEEGLGVALFTRAPNGLVPTEVALTVVPHAHAIAASARAFVRSASATDIPRGTVRVAASEIVGVEVLPAMLAALAIREPEIHIELVVSNRNEDLLRRDADLAVRMVRPTQAGLVSKKVGSVEVGLFAAPAYLARTAAPTRLAALADHALIAGDRDGSILAALGSLGLELRSSDIQLRTDNQLAQLSAVRAGLGIGPCQVPLARRGPPLVRVLPRIRFPLETHVVMHEDQRAVKRVRRVFDHLVAELTAYAS
jgi:DNA-binding transcriptional LysR family regulator